ncbi:MAG TPA: non-reducing end alpha-L-arabinofuranosidase family hydrolase [Polyangia bacterium]|nr:non-reducing end alpha-L-arabinofuranosidase family hydrolase [Polyangia bacterium]
MGGNAGGGQTGAGAGSGGASDAGADAGASGTGGVAGVTDASGSGGGAGAPDAGVTCQLPATFKWTSSGPLAAPKSPAGHDFVSLKDFTVTRFNDRYVVYATVFDSTASWSGVSFNFTDWAQADAAPQTYLGSTPLGATVAPTLFYFTPKNLWVITYQWGFKYATTTDPTMPSTWSSPKTLLIGDPTTGGGGTGPIDQTVICDGTSCYLFFAGDNGHVYRASMPIENFPGAFSNATSIMSDTQANLFEAVQVYSVKGTGQYLMIVEAMGSGGRYFRAFTATSLGGTFTAMPGASTEAKPFAGKSNVTFSGDNAWTNDISHGDIVRNDPAETMLIDACNLQFLYQGFDKTVRASNYSLVPYRPALLTLVP